MDEALRFDGSSCVRLQGGRSARRRAQPFNVQALHSLSTGASDLLRHLKRVLILLRSGQIWMLLSIELIKVVFFVVLLLGKLPRCRIP